MDSYILPRNSGEGDYSVLMCVYIKDTFSQLTSIPEPYIVVSVRTQLVIKVYSTKMLRQFVKFVVRYLGINMCNTFVGFN